MNNEEQAVEYFNSGFNCCQSTFASLCRKLSLDREIALKIAAAFGGGICRSGETCGAVTGAFMLLGLKYGMVSADDVEAKEKAYVIARQFMEEFKRRNQFIRCKELLGCDLSTDEGAAYAKENQIQKSVCPKFLRDAVAIAEEIIG
jgi:C_GCAxxG_C_C family probable redox protein